MPNAGQSQGWEQGRGPRPALRGQQTPNINVHLTGGQLWTSRAGVEVMDRVEVRRSLSEDGGTSEQRPEGGRGQ